MIQLPATSTNTFLPVGPVDADDAATEVVVDPSAVPSSDAPQGPDPLARFSSMYGLHAQAHQAGAAGAPAPAPAPGPSPAPAAPARATSPLDKPGIEGGRAWIEHGNKLLREHKYDEAVRAYEQGFLTYPDRAFILNKASALLDGGRYAEAVLAYESYLSDPDAPRADEARAAMERAMSHMNGVQPTATGIVESEKLFKEGTAAYHAGKFDEALAAFEQSHKLNPRAETKYNMAACLDRAGHKYTAVQRYQEYLQEANHPADRAKVERRIETLKTEAPNAPITARGLTGAREWMHRGNELLFAHRYDEAVEAFRAGYREYPSEKLLLNEAAALADGGRHLEADLAYTKYLNDPNAGRKDEAAQAQQRVRTEHLNGRAGTQQMLDHSRKHYDQAVVHYQAGRYADALVEFENAYALNPLRHFRFNQAACLERMGQREMAQLRYKDYLTDGPVPADAKRVEAKIAKLRGEVAALERDAFDRGQEAFQAGDFRKAAFAFAEAFSHRPRPEYQFNMATAYEKAGDLPRAIESLQRYLQLAPSAQDADAVRTRIAELQAKA